MTRSSLPLLTTDGRNRETHLPINEVFWDVVQGEGPYMGRSCGFIRLGLCNLHCPPCDTAQTWDTSRYDLAVTCPDTAVLAAVDQMPARVRMVVISGGEPLLWQRTPAFVTMLGMLKHRGIEVHVETNGTIAPLPPADLDVRHYSVSPKLTAMGGGDPLKRRIKPDVIAAFAQLAAAGRAVFKFVVADQEQIAEVADFATEHGLEPSWVWVMPEASDTATLLERQPLITASAAAYSYNVSTRLHMIAQCR
ncbi:7-carboxy-7-deazaguanine synthase QueE [Streptomyces sp. DG2A-72]|uniref:7-carboxy-7-deazaguanine synthase QueE n=1 Tax=Streptomyces sp. DG2A-72 TaxID=3051386 RepID=UPI00265C5E45|nr:7-carboxy-7-deazaguanine synthase QueE [Streptomyces sp. DG2A-72]MDO0936555.1 7-carboxy-7-deazaguanine synthase QueE [Streptomyces sp. DG2A-72]